MLSYSQSYSEVVALLKKYEAQNDSTFYEKTFPAVVTAALKEGKLSDAIKHRKEYLKYIENKYGNTSVEYAENLWKLGSLSQKDKIECFVLAEKIYFSKDLVERYEYYAIVTALFQHYFIAENKMLALTYLNKKIIASEFQIGKHYVGTPITTHLEIAHNYCLLGNLYRETEKEVQEIVKAYKNCIAILNAHRLADHYNFTEYVYSALSNCYLELDDLSSRIPIQQKIVYLKKNKYGERSSEYLEALRLLRNDYYAVKDKNSTIEISNKYIEHLRLIYNNSTCDVLIEALKAHELFCYTYEEYDSLIYISNELKKYTKKTIRWTRRLM